MNYLLVMGRGIEGAGNTRNAIELENYINNNCAGDECYAIANKDVTVGRGWDQVNDIEKISFATELSRVKACIDKADKVIVTSVPPKKIDDATKDNFMEALQYAHDNGKHITYFQFDHRIHSICRNMYFEPKYYKMFDCFDLVVTHSYDNDFSTKFLQKNGIKLKKFVARSKEINNFFSIDFDAVKNEFWKPFSSKEHRSLRFLGRSAAWKGPWEVRDLHWKWLKDAGWITYIQGIEMAINTLEHVFKEITPKKVVRDDINLVVFNKADNAAFKNGTLEFKRGTGAYVLPPYLRTDGLDAMSRSMFGIELIGMVDYIAKDMIENTMFEIVASGAVPVFSKHWAELFTIDGKPLASYPFEETGTVLLDMADPQPAVDLMNKLSDDEVAYDKCRNAAYAFYKKFFDNNVILAQLLKLVNEG